MLTIFSVQEMIEGIVIYERFQENLISTSKTTKLISIYSESILSCAVLTYNSTLNDIRSIQ